jgi:mRNA interferase RelE/StbE
MAEIRFTRRAWRDIRKLSPAARRQIEVALDELIDEPRAGDRLHGDWEGYWKLRTGDYRIIYRIAGKDVVEVQYVRHRREAYR